MNQEEQFKELLQRYEKLVYSICYRMVKNPFDAQDLTQETFLSVYKKLAEFDGTYERAWICKIAANKSLDYMKQAARKTEPRQEGYFEEMQDERAGPEEAYLQREAKEQVLTICKALKPPYDRIATEHYYKEKTAKEIAEESGQNLKTVQTQIYRAKALIKKQMEGGCGT